MCGYVLRKFFSFFLTSHNDFAPEQDEEILAFFFHLFSGHWDSLVPGREGCVPERRPEARTEVGTKRQADHHNGMNFLTKGGFLFLERRETWMKSQKWQRIGGRRRKGQEQTECAAKTIFTSRKPRKICNHTDPSIQPFSPSCRSCSTWDEASACVTGMARCIVSVYPKNGISNCVCREKKYLSARYACNSHSYHEVLAHVGRYPFTEANMLGEASSVFR
ncbi:hypothetical protein QBC38DRAFT_127614 [Podospora fimiseda]|uniref:Uncharacterized protein n=1 Tax=Podospora fimiseda TaxID=252190 RepID=A0AAN7BT30_9PEZI|nr:hypothetical protein QBC38DRAFT_127614 [Podospora fimiseda]